MLKQFLGFCGFMPLVIVLTCCTRKITLSIQRFIRNRNSISTREPAPATTTLTPRLPNPAVCRISPQRNYQPGLPRRLGRLYIQPPDSPDKPAEYYWVVPPQTLEITVEVSPEPPAYSELYKS